MIYIESIEFIFCYVVKKYQKWGEDKISGVYALCFISTLQVFNVFTVLLITLSFKVIEAHNLEKYFFLIIAIVFFLSNYFYLYKIKGRNALIEKYSIENNAVLKIKRNALIYVSITFISFLFSFIYYMLN